MLIPIDKQQLKRCKRKTKTVNVLMPETIERLQNFSENTDWNVYKEGINLHTFTEAVPVYIKFCQGICIPCKSVTKYPISCLSCNKIIKVKIKAKNENILTKSSDPELFHRTKVDLRKSIRDAKKALKDRLEKKFASNNSADIWSSIDSIANNKGPKTSVSSDDTTFRTS